MGKVLFNCVLFLPVVVFADETVFTGRLVRKYYEHLVPNAVEYAVFGWFLELDAHSRDVLQNQVRTLSVKDQQCGLQFEFDRSMVQICLSGKDDRTECRKFEGKWVEMLGDFPKSQHMFRPIPSYQVHLTEMRLHAQEFCGVLVRKVFPGPPNYDSVEDGDYPEVGWILRLDDQSKDILAARCSIDIKEIEIEAEKSLDLERHIDHKVICQGVLRDAESAHHHTPILLSSAAIVLDVDSY